MNKLSFLFSSLLFLNLISCGGSSKNATVFEITFKNISKSPTFIAQNGAGVSVAYSSLLGVVHSGKSPLYTLGSAASNGLAEMAENGNPSEFIDSLTTTEGIEVVGLANQSSANASGILGPDESFTLLLSATDPVDNLSLIATFVQANDIVVATPENGIPLFNTDGTPVSGDITSQFTYLDAGTESNEAPGIGPNQVIRQDEAAEGEISPGRAENGVVTILDDGFTYPSVSSTIKVTLKVIDQGNLPPASPSPSPSPSESPDQ